MNEGNLLTRAHFLVVVQHFQYPVGTNYLEHVDLAIQILVRVFLAHSQNSHQYKSHHWSQSVLESYICDLYWSEMLSRANAAKYLSA